MTSPHCDRVRTASTIAPDNGLFALAPWWLLAIPGGVVLWRRGERALVITCAAVAVVFMLLHLVDRVLARRLGGRPALHRRDAAVPVAAGRRGARRRCAMRRAGARRRRGRADRSSASRSTRSRCATLPYWPETLRDPLYEVTFRLARRRRRRPEPRAACSACTAWRASRRSCSAASRSPAGRSRERRACARLAIAIADRRGGDRRVCRRAALGDRRRQRATRGRCTPRSRE